MNENVVKFFELYDSDEALRKRIEDAEASYPGSLEIREALAEAVLLPVAESASILHRPRVRCLPLSLTAPDAATR